MGQNLSSPWHYVVMQMFSLLILFALFILEGSPTFGATLDSVFIGYHARVNSRVMDIQITDVGDFIQKMELDYDNEYFYFDTRLGMYWGYLLH